MNIYLCKDCCVKRGFSVIGGVVNEVGRKCCWDCGASPRHELTYVTGDLEPQVVYAKPVRVKAAPAAGDNAGPGKMSDEARRQELLAAARALFRNLVELGADPALIRAGFEEAGAEFYDESDGKEP